MKNNVKRIIATTAAAAIVTSIASMASAKEANNIYINGTLSENSQIEVINDKKFIPLRAICETLGFDVEWQNDSRTIVISSLPVYITCSPDYDGYTFARTAPMLLGDAPVIINDSTYVPMNFVEEILKGELLEKEDGIYISYGEAVEENTVSGTICDIIYEGDKLVQIVIGEKDDINSQTILNLTDELAATAKELGLEIGSQITAQITDLMTMSIPPQVIPTAISIATVDSVEIAGTVCELVYDEDKNLVQIITGEKDNVFSQKAYNLSEELSAQIIEMGIKEGSIIAGTASAAETRSIPAQSALFSIESAVKVNGTVCELVYDENNNLIQIVIGDKNDVMSQTVFNLTQKLANDATELNIKEGTKIKGIARAIMTMSIPAQQPLLTIEIDN